MKTKLFLALLVSAISLLAFMTTAYAGGHHGGGRHGGGYRSTRIAQWHKGTDYYSGHYSNECTQYDHAWHAAADDYDGHYSYDCTDYGHDYYHEICNSGYHQ